MPGAGAAHIGSHGRAGLVSAVSIGTWGRLGSLEFVVLEIDGNVVTLAVIVNQTSHTDVDIFTGLENIAVVRAISPTEAIVANEYITRALINPVYVGNKVVIPEYIRRVMAEVKLGGEADDYLIDVGNNTYLVSGNNVFIIWRG